MDINTRRALYRAKFAALRFVAIELPVILQRDTDEEKPKVQRPHRRRAAMQSLGDAGQQAPEVQETPDGHGADTRGTDRE